MNDEAGSASPPLPQHPAPAAGDGSAVPPSSLPPAGPPGPAAPPPGQWRRILLSLALLLAIGMAALLGLLAWLALSQSGAQASLALATRLSGNTVRATGVSGQLAGELRLATLTIDTLAQRIVLNDVLLAWSPSQLWSRHVHVRQLQAGSMTVAIKPDAPKSPTVLPATLALPLTLAIDALRIGSGSVGYGAVELAHFSGMAARLGFDGRQYALALQGLAIATPAAGEMPATPAIPAAGELPATHSAPAAPAAPATSAIPSGTAGPAAGSTARPADGSDSGKRAGNRLGSAATTGASAGTANPLAGQFSGTLTLGAQRPFAIAALIDAGAQASVEQRDLGARGTIRIDGNLPNLLASVDLTVHQAAASASVRGHAELHAFDAQPLGAASLVLAGLDLAAIDAALPHTGLGLTFAMAADGRGTLALANSLAGPLERNLLPLASASLALQQRQGSMRFEDMSAQLGSAARPAGEIRGSGSFDAGALELALSIQALDLQRLSGALRRTALSGSVELKHAGARQALRLALAERLPGKPAGSAVPGRAATAAGAQLALSAEAVLSGRTLDITAAQLRLGNANASLHGWLELDGRRAFAAQGSISRLRLQDLGQFAAVPPLTLNASFRASGERAPELAATLAFQISDSLVSGQPLSGQGSVELRGERFVVPQLTLRAGANVLKAQGSLANAGAAMQSAASPATNAAPARSAGPTRAATPTAQLQVELDAPQLGLLGQGFAGAVKLRGSAKGSLKRAQLSLSWQADEVRLPGQVRIVSSQGQAELMLDRSLPLLVDSASLQGTAQGLQIGAQDGLQQLASVAAQLQFGSRATAPLALALDLQGLSVGKLKTGRITITAHGATASHVLELNASESAQQWQLKAEGGLRDIAHAPVWQGSITGFEASGRFAASLAAPAPLLVSQQRFALERLRIRSSTALLEVSQFLREPQRIVTRGRLEHFNLGTALAAAGLGATAAGQSASNPAALPIDSDLVLDGQWNLVLANVAGGGIRGSASVRRLQGDITMRGDTPVALGLSKLEAMLEAGDGRLGLRVNADGQRLGHIDLAGSAALGNGSGSGIALAPDAAISASANIDVPSIAWAGALLSPSLTAEGSVRCAITVGGTLATPRLAGQINGAGLRLFLADLGIDLRGGMLEASFRDTELLLKRLEFTNGAGQLSVTGPIDLANGQPSARLALLASHYPLLDRPDRKLTIGGATSMVLQQGKANLKGSFMVESGFLDIGREGAPELSADVIIAGREKKAAARLAAAIDVRIGLGEGVSIKGRGLDALLKGEVRLLSAAGENLSATGTLNVARGTFTAYGRALAIEQGLLRFTGAPNNPALDILAMRRGQEVEAGVSVRGTVLAPRITLVSEPTVADAEKLSWLVLGSRLNAAGGSDVAALQAAAGSLLAGGAAAGVQSQLATAFGLDTVSLGTSQDTLQQRVITLGKKLSSRLYVSYQQGLQSAAGAVLLRYTLTPRLTMEAEAGAISVLSLLYNIAFD